MAGSTLSEYRAVHTQTFLPDALLRQASRFGFYYGIFQPQSFSSWH
jgi:hypothetical protein